MIEDGVDDRLQGRLGEGLVDHARRAQCLRVGPRGILDVGGDDDDRHYGAARRQLPEDLESALPRHEEVEEDQVESVPRQHIQRRLPRHGLRDLVLGQQADRDRTRGRRVVDD